MTTAFFLRIAVLLFCLPSLAFAAGAIRGRITDAATKEPLQSVTVRLPGTYYGTYTNAKGSYLVRNIAAGTYTVEISIIGYTKVQKTGVRITDGDTVVLDFALQQSDVTLDHEILV